MKTTIEQNPKVPEHPYFIIKDKLNGESDWGIGRIIWCPSPGTNILFKKGKGDENLGKFVGDKIDIDYSCYKVIDKLILETEYVNQ